MLGPRCSRSSLLVLLTFSAAVLVLLSLPQAASHRQNLYDLAFKSQEVKDEKPWEPEPQPAAAEAESDQSKPKKANPHGHFDETKWGFQLDVPWFRLPHFRASESDTPPHNYEGPGHETFATFYATRDAHMSDPYFVAAQQIVYRILWDPKSRSEKHPMTVFVAPFISEEQRAYFRAAGALVRELPVRDFVPINDGSAGRLRDMFSKLEMWHQTEFSKITYLDGDAFPLVNVDDLFELGKTQTCNKDLLPSEDQVNTDEICEYTFAGYEDFNGVNAGVLVFNPNEAMYHRLVRESLNQTQFDNGFMEQALLNIVFDPKGPFPPSYFSHAYNGGVDTKDRGEELKIVHHKLWVTGWDPDTAWYKDTFNETWLEMLDFYESDAFVQARKEDLFLAQR